VPAPHSLRGIIVEGPDGTGKSSLVKRLQAELGAGWDAVHLGHKNGDQFKRYFGVYLDADRLLVDRGHFSETVYSRVHGRAQPFAPWEQARLDRMARDEFITILCTASTSRLWMGHQARNDAAARREPGYLQSGGTTQTPTSFDDLQRAQAEFTETVGPYCTAVYQSDRLNSLDHTVGVVLRSVPETMRRAPKAPSTGAVADVILLDGERTQRARVADALIVALETWRLVNVQPWASTTGWFWHPLMWTQTVFDGGPLTRMADDSAPYRAAPADACAELYRYVAARGMVVVCGAAGHPASDRIAGDLTRWDVAHHRVNADDPAAVAGCVDRVVARPSLT
jgi:hypothetical protein